MAQPRKHNLAPGDRFTMLTVLEDRKIGSKTVMCRCDCGTERPVDISGLTSGRTRSCGCLRAKVNSVVHYKHGGGYKDYRYGLWQNIKGKCTRPAHPDYHYYGGRDITMHSGWIDDYPAFAAYLEADLGPRPKGLTLDRIDNDGNYEPGNLRWATRMDQTHNRRESVSAARWWNLTPANLTPAGLAIRAAYERGEFESYVELAAKYTLSWVVAQRIIAGLD